MLNEKVLLCLVLAAVWSQASCATLPFHLTRLERIGQELEGPPDLRGVPTGLGRGRLHVREGVPPPLCAGLCGAPAAGPVCAFDAAGTARTFATLCELQAVSCRESTYYAITSLGEC